MKAERKSKMDTQILNTKYQRQAKKIETINPPSDKIKITISININNWEGIFAYETELIKRIEMQPAFYIED